MAAINTRWLIVKLNVYFCCSLQLLVTSLKEEIDTPLGSYKHKMAASNFIKILTAPQQNTLIRFLGPRNTKHQVNFRLQ